MAKRMIDNDIVNKNDRYHRCMFYPSDFLSDVSGIKAVKTRYRQVYRSSDDPQWMCGRGGDGDEMDRSLRRRRDRPDVFPVFDAGIYTGSWKKGHPDSFWNLRGSLPLHSGSDLCAVVPVIPDAARRASAQKNVGQPGFDADIP